MNFPPIFFKPPQPIGATRTAIEELAANTAAALDVDRGDHYWLEKMVNAMGGRIDHSAATQGLSLEMLAVKDFTIYTGTMTSLMRDRASVAAALGHCVLHAPKLFGDHPDFGMRIPRHPDHPHAPCETARREAVQFASGLLMPEAGFRKAWAEGGPEQCLKEFPAPRPWIEMRAKQFGLAVPEPEFEEMVP